MNALRKAIVAFAAAALVAAAAAETPEQDPPPTLPVSPIERPDEVPRDGHKTCESCQAELSAITVLKRRIEERRAEYPQLRNDWEKARTEAAAAARRLFDLVGTIGTYNCTRQELEKLADAKGVRDLEKEFAEKCGITSENIPARFNELLHASVAADARVTNLRATLASLAAGIAETQRILASHYSSLDACEIAFCKKPRLPQIAQRPRLPECIHYGGNWRGEMKVIAEQIEAFILKAKSDESALVTKLSEQPEGRAWNFDPILQRLRDDIAWGQKQLDGALWDIRDCDGQKGEQAGGGSNAPKPPTDQAANTGNTGATGGGASGCDSGGSTRRSGGIAGRIQDVSDRIEGAGCR